MLSRAATIMLHSLRATATVFEVLWTLPALLALALRLWLLGLVTADVRYLERQQQQYPDRDLEAEHIWSGSQLWHKLALASVLALMAAFGLVAMLTPQPPAPPSRLVYVLTAVFILIPTILAADAVQTLMSRFRTRMADDERARAQRRRATDVPEAKP